MPYTPRARGQEFRVLGKNRVDAMTYAEHTSTHLQEERVERMERIRALGVPKLIMSYIVDTNHVEGVQLHSLYTTGVVAIASVKYKKLITMFIATPAQIHRYTDKLPNLERLARIHMERGLTHD